MSRSALCLVSRRQSSSAARLCTALRRRTIEAALFGALAAWVSATASAQDAPPPSAPPAPPSETPAPVLEPVPTVTPAPPPAPPVAIEPATPPVTTTPEAARAKEPPPAVEDDGFKPKLTIGVGLRTGLSLAFNPGDKVTFSLSDSLDQFMFRPFFAGQLTKNLGLFVQANGGATSFGLIDAYFDVKIVPEFSLVLGQHIPANDRNNFSGPFFNNSWNFAAVHSYPFDAAARDRGFTFWGLLAKDIIKYHLSLVDLEPGREIGDARFAGRLTLNFLKPETSYYFSETYFGKSDTLAIGGVFSYQNGVKGGTDRNMDGKVDNDFVAFSFDFLFEKNFGAVGTFTLSALYENWNNVGADYRQNQGIGGTGSGFVGALSGFVTGQSYQVNVSWLSPTKLGYGQLQPNIRVQGFDKDAGDAMIYDVGLGYIVDGFNHLWRVNYRHANNPGGGSSKDEDSLQIGAQMQI